MPRKEEWKIANIFISSTFRDMYSERDHLVKRVFPKLRAMLLRYKIQLQEYDLRWGVSEDQILTGGALKACLNVIDESRPFFLGLVGERYGTPPSENDISVLFKRFNCSEDEMRSKSITQLEVAYGLTAVDREPVDALFMLRDPLPKIDEQSILNAFCFETDSFKIKNQESFRKDISKLSSPHVSVASYPAVIDGILCLSSDVNTACLNDVPGAEQKGNMLFLPVASLAGMKPHQIHACDSLRGFLKISGLDEFEATVYQQLKRLILHKFGMDEENPPTKEDISLQSRNLIFVDRLLGKDSYVNRSDAEQFIRKYVENDSLLPLFISGGEGYGKTATLTYLYREWLHAEEPAVHAVFVGGEATSATRDSVLSSLFPEVIHHETGDSRWDRKRVMQNVRRLKETDGRKTVIIIDGVDLLTDLEEDCSFSWVPERLPEGTKLLICFSSNTRLGIHLKEALSYRNKVILVYNFTGLSLHEKEALLIKFSKQTGKVVTKEQGQILTNNTGLNTPLLVAAALTELRFHGCHESIDDKVQSVGEDVISRILERFSDDYGVLFAIHLYALIASHRYGVSETELLQLMKNLHPDMDEDNFYALLRELRPWLLIERDILFFANEQLKQACLSLLAKRAVAVRKILQCVSSFLEERLVCADHDEDLYFRHAAELLWQYYQLKDGELAEAALSRSDILAGTIQYPGSLGILIGLIHERKMRHSVISGILKGAAGQFEGVGGCKRSKVCINLSGLLSCLLHLEQQDDEPIRQVVTGLNKQIADLNSNVGDRFCVQAQQALHTRRHSLRTMNKLWDELSSVPSGVEERYLHGMFASRLVCLSSIKMLGRKALWNAGLVHAQQAIDGFMQFDEPDMYFQASLNKAALLGQKSTQAAGLIYIDLINWCNAVYGPNSYEYTCEAKFCYANLLLSHFGHSEKADLIHASDLFEEVYRKRSFFFSRDSYDAVKALYSKFQCLYLLGEFQQAFELFRTERDVLEMVLESPLAFDRLGLQILKRVMTASGDEEAVALINQAEKKIGDML